MPVDKVTELVKGLKVGADIPLAGTQFLGAQIPTLFFPLTDLDIRRLRWVGKTNHDLLTTIARQIEPGMTELEIAAEIQRAYTRRNMTLDVLIVGVDERVFRYRHPLPTERVLKNYALLHPAARRWGLHANVTRLVHFGPLPNEIQRAVDGVLTIEGRILGMISEGMHFADVLVEQKRWYSEVGFPEDWRYHFQGGITSYSLADPTQSLNPAARMVMRQAFDYFVTITGAKSEELVLLTEEGVEIASFGGDWPRRAIKTPRGEFEVPDILIRS
jgi:antitoxin VapB